MKFTMEGEPQEIAEFLATLANKGEAEARPEREEQNAPPAEPVAKPSRFVGKERAYPLHPTRNTGPNSIKERAFRFLTENPGATLTDISRGIDMPARKLNARVRELVLANRVNRVPQDVGHSKYYVTEAAIEGPVHHKTEDGTVILKLQDESKGSGEALYDRILELLRQRGPMRVEKLSNLLSRSVTHLNLALIQLEEEKRVNKVADPTGVFIYRAVPATDTAH